MDISLNVQIAQKTGVCKMNRTSPYIHESKDSVPISSFSKPKDASSIDPFTEDVFPLSQAPKHLRCHRVHSSTVFRWVKRGLRGKKLETIKIGGVTCTSENALRRFFNSLSSENTLAVKKPIATTRKSRVEKELFEFGI